MTPNIRQYTQHKTWNTVSFLNDLIPFGIHFT